MWRISADTGGTFTDCYAVTPDGVELRCKVLSTGCLRARIERIVIHAADAAHPSHHSHSSHAVQITAPWNVPDGFFTGFTATPAGAAEDARAITDPEIIEQRYPVLLRELKTAGA